VPGTGAERLAPQPLAQASLIDLRRERLSQLAAEIRQQVDQTPDLAALSGHIQISLTDEGLQIEMVEDSVGVFFESGSATPREAGLAVLRILGQELGHVPNKIIIEGYTDAQPYHRADGYSNWELSADRANTTRRIMTEAGLSPDQVSQVRGYADRKLKDPANPLSPLNRRVSITMMMPPRVRPDSNGTAPATDSLPAEPSSGATGR
jgi:chemotaxis protein MotB